MAKQYERKLAETRQQDRSMDARKNQNTNEDTALKIILLIITFLCSKRKKTGFKNFTEQNFFKMTKHNKMRHSRRINTTEIKNSVDKFQSKLHSAKKKISKKEDISKEIYRNMY